MLVSPDVVEGEMLVSPDVVERERLVSPVVAEGERLLTSDVCVFFVFSPSNFSPMASLNHHTILDLKRGIIHWINPPHWRDFGTPKS